MKDPWKKQTRKEQAKLIRRERILKASGKKIRPEPDLQKAIPFHRPFTPDMSFLVDTTPKSYRQG